MFFETPAGREVLNGIVFAIGGNDLMRKAVNPYRIYDTSQNSSDKCNCLKF